MNRIGFLACPETLPASLGGASQRRGDAFEHDLMVSALRPAFAGAGLELTEIDWRAPPDRFADIPLVLLGTAWDYQDHPEEFIARLEALERSGVSVCNPPSLVRWNMDKRYLLDLEAAGACTIPTLWHDDPCAGDVVSAFNTFGCERLVIKRQVGAGGIGQQDFCRDAPPPRDWRFGHAAMIQPFLETIASEGELSFVFIDGEFSHAIRKTAANGEYRIQSLYGGREEKISPSADDIGSAKAILTAMPGEPPLYARIDMLRGEDEALMVMEAEAIEPYLYPEQGPDLGTRLADAIIARLGRVNCR